MNNSVYTFFEPIDAWDYSKKLVDLWVENWSNNGFNPIVLNKSDAESHEYYDYFSKTIIDNYSLLFDKNIFDNSDWGDYLYYCFIRHLAYAKHIDNKAPALVLDYDVYNITYKRRQLNKNKIGLFCNMNPCCISGTGQMFFDLCKLMAEFTSEHIDEYKNSIKNSKLNYPLHDMGWIHYTLHLNGELKDRLKNNISFESNMVKPYENKPYSGLAPYQHLVHISFGWLKRSLSFKDRYPHEFSQGEKVKMRYELAKEYLKQYEN